MTEPNRPPAIDYASPINEPNASAVQVGIVGLKLLGLMQFVSVLQWLPYLMSLMFEGGIQLGAARWSMFLAPAISLLVGFVLIFRASTIAPRLFGGLQEIPIQASPAAWMTILVSAIGLYLIVSSLAPAVKGVVSFLYNVLENIGSPSPTFINGNVMIAELFPLSLVGLGLSLFLRPRWLLSWWQRKVKL
jgi:hypothetical protein